MREYKIADEIITISTALENQRYLEKNTTSLVVQAEKSFNSWCSLQSDAYSLYKNSDAIIVKTIMPIVKKAVELLNEQSIYTVNEEIFISQYMDGYKDTFDDVLDAMLDRLDEIDEQQSLEREYRRMRKASRGRVVGGGFGLSGALKGMAMAGVMNATTGMAHSLGNAIGNLGSSMASSSSRAAVLSNVKEPLKEAFIYSVLNVISAIKIALEQEADIYCKGVSQIESDQANAILQSFTQGKIANAQKKEQILRALLLDPYKMLTYEIIWKEYGDQNGDLCKMSSYFDCSIKNKTMEWAKEYGTTLFSEKCKMYVNAFDKQKVAMQSEYIIKDVLEQLKCYCKKRGIQEGVISEISQCNEILRKVDVAARTVNNTVYSTREKAGQVKNDYRLFYNAIAGKNLFAKETYTHLQTLNFSSKEFRDGLSKIYEAECNLREPEFLYDNIISFLKIAINANKLRDMSIDVPSKLGNFQDKEFLVRTITEMPEEEVPLFFVDRSGNGKSGVLITNMSFRIFSKVFLSNDNRVYPIDKIEKIECVATDTYTVKVFGQEILKTHLKQKKLTVEEQIKFGKTLDDIVSLIKNIFPERRKELYRKLYGVATCACGMHLLSGESICPRCFKLYKEDGEFVDTEKCPSCGNYVQKGKKFCSICGNQLLNNFTVQNDIIEENSCEGSDIKDVNSLKTDYITCLRCGNIIINGKKFCSRCGEPVSLLNSIKEEQIYCPNCGSKIKYGKKFCQMCGTKIQ